jgi:cytochrome b
MICPLIGQFAKENPRVFLSLGQILNARRVLSHYPDGKLSLLALFQALSAAGVTDYEH